MKITVVTVCYNVASTIEATIKSVLGQTHDDIEYIIIDGGSTDGTADVIRRYAPQLAYWVSEPDKGIYDAMNKGLAKATGDYINFMNAGDKFSYPTTVAEMVEKIKPDTDVIYGDAISVGADGSRRIIPGGHDLKRLAMGPVYRHNASFTRTSLHKEIPFATDKADRFQYALDFNQIFTMWKRGAKFRKADVTVVDYEKAGTSCRPIRNKILNFRIIHQFDKATPADYAKLSTNLLKVWLKSLLR